MHRFGLRLLPATLLLAFGLVQAAPPSQAQIDQLLDITRTRESLAAMLPQIEASQRQLVQQMLADQEYTQEQQHALDAQLAESMTSIAALLSWEELQPLYHDLYVQTFDAEEVQAMIDFYASPAGQSMVQKMPHLMHNVMQAVQTKLLPLLQSLQHQLESQTGAGHSH